MNSTYGRIQYAVLLLYAIEQYNREETGVKQLFLMQDMV